MSGKIWSLLCLVLSLWMMACFNPHGNPPDGASGESSGDEPGDPTHAARSEPSVGWVARAMDA